MLTHSRVLAIETDCICNGMKTAGAGVWGLPGTEVPRVLKLGPCMGIPMGV